MEKYAHFAAEKPHFFLALIMVMNVLAIIGIFMIKINPEVKRIFGEENEAMKRLEKMEDIFQSGEEMGVLIHDETLPSAEGFKKILDVQKRLENIDGVKKVIGVPEKVFKGFRVIDVKQFDEKTLTLIEGMLKHSPVKRYGKGWFFLTLVLKPDVNEAQIVRSVEEALKGTEYSITGNVYIEQKMFDYILIILLAFIPAIVGIILTIFSIRLGSIKAGLFSIAPAGMAAGWSLGLMGLSGFELSLLTVLVPIFVIILGSADALHLLSHYLETEKGPKGMAKALKVSGVAIIMTTLTTMAGFLSFLPLPARGLKQLGGFAAMGIGLAAVSTWLFLPAILPRQEFRDLPESRLGKFFMNVKVSRVVISLVIVALIFPGIFLLKKEFSVIGFYRSWTSVRKSYEEIMEKTGFALPAFIYGEVKNPISKPSAQKVLQLEEELKKVKGTKQVFSIYDVIIGMSEYLLGKREYPPSAPLIFMLLKNSDPESVEAFIKGNNVRIMLSLDEDSDLDRIDEIAEKRGMITAGVPFILKQLNDEIVPSQVASIVLAMSLVLAMMIVMTRNLKRALISVVPISLTLVILFGFMGYAHIPLNITTTIMAAITIGVGIDYAIHYTALHEKFGRDRAIESASAPILANALGFALGYTPMVFSPLMIHLYLALIMWVTMITSATLSLIILPVLLGKGRN